MDEDSRLTHFNRRRVIHILANLFILFITLDLLVLILYGMYRLSIARVQPQRVDQPLRARASAAADSSRSIQLIIRTSTPPARSLSATHTLPTADSPTQPQPPTPPAPTRADGELIIPALNIAETPAQVSVRSGEWDLTGLGSRVGWLQTTGAYPQDARAMVFIGHTTLRASGAGPFYNLRSMQPGSEIYYHTGTTRYTYRVAQINTVRPTSIHALYPPGSGKLLLVTCTNWNILSASYENRLIVTAELTNEENLASSP